LGYDSIVVLIEIMRKFWVPTRDFLDKLKNWWVLLSRYLVNEARRFWDMYLAPTIKLLLSQASRATLEPTQIPV